MAFRILTNAWRSIDTVPRTKAFGPKSMSRAHMGHIENAIYVLASMDNHGSRNVNFWKNNRRYFFSWSIFIKYCMFFFFVFFCFWMNPELKVLRHQPTALKPSILASFVIKMYLLNIIRVHVHVFQVCLYLYESGKF